jgi:signal transduction histidine kinase/CheY-like chemotaxis protein
VKIRTKALLTIIAITAPVTILSLGIGLFSIRDGMEDIVINDMKMHSNIVSKLVTSRLALLEGENRNIAERLRDIRTGKVVEPEKAALIQKEAAQRYDYLSIALFDAAHRPVATYGDAIPDASYADNEYAQRAYRGEVIVSSTENTADGMLVIRVYTPINDHLLISTLPGFIMSDLASEFRILGSGNVFILDKTGVTIANTRPETVMERYNLVEMAQDTHRHLYSDEGSLFKHMIKNESGIGYYSYDGENRVCAYTPVLGSDGWSVGVAAPVSATSVAQTEQVLLIAGGIILIVSGIVAIFASDVIARPFEIIHEQNDSLRQLTQVAENASATKSSFLANTSHEMRTPLNAIIGLSELTLGTDSLPAEAAGNLEKIYTSGMTLLGIVNDLLDVAKIESGKFELIPTEYDVPSMINDTRSLNVLTLADRPITFHLKVDGTIPGKLVGDELRVKQIFNNLLSNACKYTREGTIEWSISWERDRGENVWLLASITDTGIGIHKEDIGKLFADFKQVNIRKNRKITGTGLGLAITRRLVQTMDGVVTVESEYGKGSTFKVRIRQKCVTDTPIGAEVVEALQGYRYTTNNRVRNMKLVRVQMPYARVLVVDDVQTNLDVAKGIMKPYGMKVDCVLSGIEAVNLIRKANTRYDAIFMDQMMPEMDGIEATRVIREEIGTDYAKHIPVIALTANAIIGNEKLFLENGFQAFLTKPIDVMRMDGILRQWVRNKELESKLEASGELATNSPEQVHEKHAPGTSDTPHIEGVDWEAGLNRFGEDKETYLSVIRSYVTNTAQLLEKIRSVTVQTLPDYAILVHGIKGSSYGIEAKEIGKKAETLEFAAKDGNFEFVSQNNSPFIEATEKLLADFSSLPGVAIKNDERERRPAPDEALLDQIEEAAANFRFDAMEEAMNALEQFQYETEQDLLNWLREEVQKMEFAEIQERLAQRKQKAGEKGDNNG